MSLSPKDALVALIPNLRAFARTLCNDAAAADDLVQDTLVKAWDHFDTFKEGTNLKAWLFTILRNTYFSEWRKRKRQCQDRHAFDANTVAVAPEQQGHVDLDDFCRALKILPDEQREALILVGAAGFSYEEAAEICGCAVGTVKSRVNRARGRLADLLGASSAHEFGPDSMTGAILARAALPHR
jgi:RNA polymerase sigma-70 factor (ECF subfamily)